MRPRFSRIFVSLLVAVGCGGRGAVVDGSTGPDGTGTEGEGSMASTSGATTSTTTGGSGMESDSATGGTTSIGSASTSAASTTGSVECKRTLFVNFDGATLTMGIDDAPNDVSQVFEGTLGPYAGESPREEILAEVEAHMAPFSICVTDQRPAEGPYTMVVVTSDGIVGGSGAPDCGDANPNNVAIVSAAAFGGSVIIANMVSRLYGRSVGLDVQNELDEDVMYSAPAGTKQSFVNACLELLDDPAPTCAVQHTAFCPDGRQNSFAELAALAP